MLKKLGLYLKYFLRNDFLKMGPVCSKTVVKCHFCIFCWKSFFCLLRTINAITSVNISFESLIILVILSRRSTRNNDFTDHCSHMKIGIFSLHRNCLNKLLKKVMADRKSGVQWTTLRLVRVKAFLMKYTPHLYFRVILTILLHSL